MMEIVAPIIVALGEDCAFYRTSSQAIAAGIPNGALVFDMQGRRLEAMDGALRVSATNPDGADELVGLLRRWLGYMDALRESTASWPPGLLVHASVDHQGYATD
jgi:hypothetical protein